MLQSATLEDWEDIRRLSIQAHDLHVKWRPDIYRHTEEPLSKSHFLELIKDRLIYVAKMNGKVIGFVTLDIITQSGSEQVPCKNLRIMIIAVDEKYRRQGIGTEMITDVRSLAKAFGCKKVLLGVYPENLAGLKFYEKCGFTVRSVNMEHLV